MEIYDEKMMEWPIPYEDIFVDTEYGKVHVIASGPEDAPPMLLVACFGRRRLVLEVQCGGIESSTIAHMPSI